MIESNKKYLLRYFYGNLLTTALCLTVYNCFLYDIFYSSSSMFVDCINFYQCEFFL